MAWKYREVQIRDDESIGDSGTKTIDINVTDPITALIIRFKVKNAAAATPNQPPERNVTKVEIVDGGQVHFSLNGQEAVGAACYGLGQWPSHWYAGNTSYTQRINFPLLFGRYLGDEVYGFDPRKLLNPQLKITWSDQALYLDDNHTLGVTARVMEGLASPAECLMWTQVEAWQTASAGEHTVDLPTDRPIRALMMRPWADTELPFSIWTHFKMDCDLGKFIVFDLNKEEFKDILKQMDGTFMNRQMAEVESGNYRHAWLGDTLSVTGGQGSATRITDLITMNYPRVLFSASLHDGSGAGVLGWEFVPIGHFPHNCLLYRFGRKDVPETWFPASSYGEIALKITEGIASCDASVSVQRPVRL